VMLITNPLPMLRVMSTAILLLPLCLHIVHRENFTFTFTFTSTFYDTMILEGKAISLYRHA